ncbi:MAG: tol-pal system protein YbgF [Gammaproteobacteria bacterium]
MRKQLIILSSLLITTLAQADVPVYDAYQHETVNSTVAQSQPDNFAVQSKSYKPTKQVAPPAPVSTRNLSTNQRIALLEQQSAYQSQQNYSQQIANLQQQVQTLQGQLEVSNHEVERLQQQLQNMFQDLDNRVSKLGGQSSNVAAAESASAVYSNANAANSVNDANKLVANNSNLNNAIEPAKTALVNSATQPNQDNNSANFLSDQDAYLMGYNAIKNRNYAQASKSLKSYIQQYPSGQYAASAHYWLGELYSIDGKTNNAIAEFQTVVQKYPTDPKVSSAKLKIGFLYCDSGQVDKGKKQLQAVKKDYPGTSAAKLATERLNEINRG